MGDDIDWFPIHQRQKESSMWRLWAVAEGLAKTFSAVFQKAVGNSMGTLEMGCIAASIIGLVQVIVGFGGHAVVSPDKRSSLIPDRKSIALLLFLGFLAGIFGTVLSIYTFTMGADLAIRTLLITSSVIPASVIAAWLWPKTDSLNVSQVFGIGLFLVSIWSVLDFPSLSVLADLKPWVLLTLLLACVNALGELVVRSTAARFDIWVNSIWIGSSTIAFSLMGLGAFLFTNGTVGIDMTRVFFVGSIIIGVIAAGMLVFRILAYQGGGTIALKKIIMPGVYIITAMLAGVWFYGEPLTMGKIVGIVLGFLALYFVDTKARADLVNVIVTPRKM